MLPVPFMFIRGDSLYNYSHIQSPDSARSYPFHGPIRLVQGQGRVDIGQERLHLVGALHPPRLELPLDFVQSRRSSLVVTRLGGTSAAASTDSAGGGRFGGEA